jgi:hypothetical protein
MDLKSCRVKIIPSFHLQKERIKNIKATSITRKAKMNFLLLNSFFTKAKVIQNRESKKSQTITTLPNH